MLNRKSRSHLSHLPSHILTRQSLPPVTNLLTGGCAAGLFGPVAAAVDPPGTTEGAQLTELTPIGCAWKIWWLQLLSLNSSTETLPSEEAHARRQPASCGAQLTRFTLAVCCAYSKIFDLLYVSINVSGELIPRDMHEEG